MKEIFPWIFAAALLLAGSAFLYAGVKLTSTAWTLKTSGEQTTATIEIRYRHDDPSVAAPVNGSPLGIQGPILIIAGLALLAFGARWTIVKLL